MNSVHSNSKFKFEKRTMLSGKATLPLWNEPSHDYVSRLRRLSMGRYFYVFGRRTIYWPKIENVSWTKCYLFSILYTPAKFLASRFNNIKNIAKSVDPLKYSVPSIFWDSRQKIRPYLKLVMDDANWDLQNVGN